MSVFFQSVGKLLASVDGLISIKLPSQLDSGAIESIVDAANKARHIQQNQEPYAVVVGDAKTLILNSRVRVLDLNQTIRYRTGNRLFLMVDSTRGLVSIDRVVKMLLDESFPEKNVEPASLKSIARAVHDEILETMDISNHSQGYETRLAFLESAFMSLRELYKHSAVNISADWNLLWYRHVDLGIKNLIELLGEIKTSSPSLQITDFFCKYTFAAFGLPTPDKGATYKDEKKLGSVFQSAIDSYWSDSDQISTTISHLRSKRGDHLADAISSLNWSDFDQSRTALDSHYAAFLSVLNSSNKDIFKWSELFEQDFLYPMPKEIAGALRIYIDRDAEPQLLPEVGATSNIHAVIGDGVVNSDKNTIVQQVKVQIKIPVLQALTQDDVNLSALKITGGKNKSLNFDGALHLENSNLWAIGTIEIEVSASKFKYETIHLLEVKLPAGDSLAGKIDDRATTRLICLDTSNVGCLYATIDKANKLKSFSHVGPKILETPGSDYATELDSSQDHYLIGWAENCFLKGIALEPWIENIFAERVKVESIFLLRLDESNFEFTTSEQIDSHESPVIAAAKKTTLSAEEPNLENRNSLFGLLEEQFSRLLTSPLKDSLLHFVLPQGTATDFSSLEEVDQDPIFVSNDEILNGWKSVTSFKVSKDFISSAEVEAFKSAFEQLDVQAMLEIRGSSRGVTDWISRTSWAYLAGDEKQKLDDYLGAYEAMVLAARTYGDPATLFWASYPFSASIWDTKQTGKCSAIFLSPIHPLRLGWLSNAEHTLREVDDCESLAGAIEGWNFPAVGPGPSSNSLYLAVPTEAGVGQVFLGWATLLAASTSGFESPTMPSDVGGVATPGGGASGLNESSVQAAIKDYRRINPHVSTMTVDLAAATPTPRLRDLDNAILKSLRRPSDSGNTYLPGGLRVLDSLNRSGNPPLNEALQVIDGQKSVPMTWTRYTHNGTSTNKCNIRFLQESGVRIELDPGFVPSRYDNRGVMGQVPLRRFEAYTTTSGLTGYAASTPCLGQSSFFGMYERALVALENPTTQVPVIKSQLFRALLVDEKADWTVSGEALVNPSSIADLLSQDRNAQMLWEWRPPLFDITDELVLEKRPFISVARIPLSFKNRVKSRLEKATELTATIADADSVLNNLGRRGVGLSSLMAMGETHSAGALGFHITLMMLDSMTTQDRPILVMPIDACYPFLNLLAGTSSVKNATQRADLLAISFSETNICLTPVEIKFYGLDSSSTGNSKLPTAADKVVEEAKEQAFESKKLIEAIVSKYTSIAASGTDSERALWLNSLAAFFESAVKINNVSDDNANLLASAFRNILSGTSSISVGKPFVAFYTSNGFGSNGETEVTAKIDDSTTGEKGMSWALYSANTQSVFGQIADSTFKPSENLRLLGHWSLSSEELTEFEPENETKDTQSDSPYEPSPKPKNEGEIDVAGEFVGQEKPESEGEPEQDHSPQPQANSDGGSGDVNVNPSSSSTHASPSSSWPSDQGVRITIGSTRKTIAESRVDFWPGNTALTQMNVGVVGDLGTGKTQFLKSMITQIRHAGREAQDTPISFLIFDYKRDYKDQDFLNRVGGVILSPDEGIPLNVLALSGTYSKNKAVKKSRSFADLLAKIYGGIGPLQKDRLSTAIIELFEGSIGHTAPNLTQVRDHYLALASGKVDAVVSILNGFVQPGVFIEDPSQVKEFGEIIADKVVVVSLNEFGANANDKNALVFMMLDLYYEYMQTNTKWPFAGTDPQIRKLNSFLLVDEATNIMKYEFPILMNILLEGREWGFGTILASQYLSHFKTTELNYAQPLQTWVIHKVPSVKLSELVQIGLSSADANTVDDIANLKVHEAIYDSLNSKALPITGLPFYKL